jgi:hypothetical protein
MVCGSGRQWEWETGVPTKDCKQGFHQEEAGDMDNRGLWARVLMQISRT